VPAQGREEDHMARELGDRKVGAQRHHFVYAYAFTALQHPCMRCILVSEKTTGLFSLRL